MRRGGIPAWALLALAVGHGSIQGQRAPLPRYAPDSLRAEDYARAERLLAPSAAPLLLRGAVRPNWLPDDRLWYRNAFEEGVEYILADPGTGTRDRAFDHVRLAASLSALTGERLTPFSLPIVSIAFPDGDRELGIGFSDGRNFSCTAPDLTCRIREVPARPGREVVVSPDGRLGAFIREHDLWIRELGSGEEFPLTHDGVEDFGYATDNAGWIRDERPVVVWSPDSRRIATFQHDGRGVGDMVLTTTNVGHPEADIWKYPLPGDSAIFMIHRVILDVPSRSMVRLRMPPDPHRSTTCDHVVCNGVWSDVSWFPDGERLAFVSTPRDHRGATLRIADAGTGEVRTVHEERTETFYEAGPNTPNWRILPQSEEFLWYSQRENWGHLYLHDLRTGALKGRVTSGDWNVLEILELDEEERRIVFTGVGREAGDPYFHHLYSVDLDGSDLRRLTPDSAHHQVSLSPSGRWFLDVASTPSTPPVSTLRDPAGREVVRLETADISRLQAAGWTPPISFTVKARDGQTDLHGLMYLPTGFDSTRALPIINHIYPGPQTGSVGSRAFSPARGDARALAELGFVVVQIDAMGTPFRSKAFHDAYYGNMGDNGLPDQVAGMRELARRHRWIDLERAGIYGHSGGGFASAAALFRYPDFFRVGVSQAGNHDNRNYEDDWAEKWQGLLVRNPDGTTNYDNQANQLIASNLRGKLLLAHGTLDDNVPFHSTLLVVDALIEANRDFDLIVFPNRRHGFGNEPYMVRRRWDYFVEHLLGARPPAGVRIGAGR